MAPAQGWHAQIENVSLLHFWWRQCAILRAFWRIIKCRSYSVMVITKDFESFDPGSSPGRTFLYSISKNQNIFSQNNTLYAESLPRWRNWIAHQTSNLGVAGLNPARGVLVFLCAGFIKLDTPWIAHGVSLWPNWIRRLTTNQKIGGSSPSRDIIAWMPEGSKGADLRSAGRLSAWVRTPLQALSFFIFLKNSFLQLRVVATPFTASMA